MNNTLRGKVQIVYFGLVLLIILIALLGLFNLYHLELSFNGIISDNYRSIVASNHMTQAINGEEEAALTLLLGETKKAVGIYAEADKSFENWFISAENNITEEGEKDLILEMKVSYGKLLTDFLELKVLVNANRFMEAKAYYDEYLVSDIRTLERELLQLRDLNEREMLNDKERAISETKSSMFSFIMISLITIIGGFLVSSVFVAKFLEPLQKLTFSVKKVQAGDLGQLVEIQSSDEIGILAKEFNEMTERLLVYEKSSLGTILAEKNKTLAIVKSMGTPIIVLDENRCIQLINSAGEDFFGLSEQELLGNPISREMLTSELHDLILSALENPENLSWNEKKLKGDGDEFTYFNVLFNPIRSEFGEEVGSILILQDVTRIKELERNKTDFVATVSHEFKTPLTSIMMANSLLASGAYGELNSEEKELVETIQEESNRLQNLVNELIEIAKIEAGEDLYNFRPCDFFPVVEKSIHGLTELASEKGIRIRNNVSKNLPLVYIDEEKILWVVNNLLNNGIKYSGDGEELLIAAEREGDYLRIDIADHGEGIPFEYLEKIFDKFVRIENRDIEIRGTGLGLSVSKDIVSNHDGVIYVKSELNQGSTFTFTLPIWKEQ